jgi:hypothetical protein
MPTIDEPGDTMRARRAAAIWALLAFLLGVALGPVLGWERQTVVTDTLTNINRMRSLAADGWTVNRSDSAFSDVRLITLERPRLVGLWRAAGDLYNNAAGWLAWATSTGAYSRR